MGSDNEKKSLYDSWSWDGGYSTWTPEEKPLTKKCSCGMSIAMGYEVPNEMHSDWCDLVRKEKNDTSIPS